MKKRDGYPGGVDGPERTRGILRPREGLEVFDLELIPPDAALAPFVEYHWLLRWDARGRDPHRQRVLTRPTVHMTFTNYLTSGRTRARIVGVVKDAFVEEIPDEGRVVGVAFLPGGFRPFLGAPVSTVTGQELAVEDVFGLEGSALAAGIFETACDKDAVARLERFLLARAPEPDPSGLRAAEIVRRIAADPALVRVDGVARDAGLSPRALQRLFSEYIGVGPKWVIRRYRMLDAAGRAAAGTGIDWAELAAELGFADQAHFTRAFTAAVGTPPARYAREAAAATIEP